MVVGNRQASRIDVVKAVVGDFVERREGDRLGLILFAAHSYVQAPLTFDRETVGTLLEEAEIGIIEESATAIGDAIGLAVIHLRNRPENSRVLVLLTDGVNNAGAVSPVGARGIAQFMPYTAKERGLDDPYDARQALRHSALYLADLRAELGNWGLAAAAYNGGINRVKRWLVSGGSLPYETEDYVNAITFRPADWFREDGRELEPRPLDEDRDFDESCARLPIMKTRAVFAAFEGVESAPMRPWGVQVAGHARQAVAMKMFRRVQSRFGAILKDRDPLVIRGRNGARQRIYAVRIGADTRGEADALCGRLRGAGGSCVVLKN